VLHPFEPLVGVRVAELAGGLVDLLRFLWAVVAAAAHVARVDVELRQRQRRENECEERRAQWPRCASRRSSRMHHGLSVNHGFGDCKPAWHFLLPASPGHLVLLTHGGPPAAKPACRARRPRPNPRRVGPGGTVLWSGRRSGLSLRSPPRRGAGSVIVALLGSGSHRTAS